MRNFNDCDYFMTEREIQCANQNKLKLNGKIERFQIEGDKKGSLNGWLVWRDDYNTSCTFGSWKTGEHYTWFAEDISQLSKQEFKEMKRKATEARIEAQRIRRMEEDIERRNTRANACMAWNDSDDYSCIVHEHEYVERKCITPYGAKISNDGRDLLIPVMSHTFKIQSLQRIRPDGMKLFMPGGSVKGNFHYIDQLCKGSQDMAFVCEGFATACTVHEITKQPVYVAFNAGNLEHIAKIARMEYPKMVVICADNDFKTDGNPGETKASEAARKANCKWMPLGSSDCGTDWNDIAVKAGMDEASGRFSLQYDLLTRGQND